MKYLIMILMMISINVSAKNDFVVGSIGHVDEIIKASKSTIALFACFANRTNKVDNETIQTLFHLSLNHGRFFIESYNIKWQENADKHLSRKLPTMIKSSILPFRGVSTDFALGKLYELIHDIEFEKTYNSSTNIRKFNKENRFTKGGCQYLTNLKHYDIKKVLKKTNHK